MEKFILNEKTFAENSLKSGDEIDHPRRILNLLAQYHYQIDGYRKTTITKLLIDYLKKHYPPYEKSKEQWDDVCATIAHKTGGNPLLECEGVQITEAELNAIQRANNKQLERLAFVMLCIAKLNICRNENMNGWVNADVKTIFQCARIGGTNQEKHLQIHELFKLGLVELPRKIDKVNYRVTFINDDSPVIMTVDDFRELGYVYQLHMGERLFKCPQCGKLERPFAPYSGLCKECEKKNKEPQTRTSKCVDCGESFTVDARVANKCRCDKCQTARNREMKRAWKLAHSGSR